MNIALGINGEDGQLVGCFSSVYVVTTFSMNQKTASLPLITSENNVRLSILHIKARLAEYLGPSA